MKNQLIIGIGGISRSGKSGLAKKIAHYYSSSNKSVALLHQDDLVFDKSQIPKIKNRIDWEQPDSMDFVKQLNLLEQEIRANQVVIFEGMLVFFDERINQKFNCRILCEIDKLSFIRRKKKDLRWGLDPDWYIEHSWDSYHRYGRNILQHPKNEIHQNLIYIYQHAFDNRLTDLIELIENIGLDKV